MRTVTTFLLTAAIMFAAGSAFAQTAGTPGAGLTGGYPTSVTTTGPILSPGVGTTPSTTPGIGNGENPGIGDRSDPSIRANVGLDANGPCNGARSTSGNNTPSC